MLSSLCNKNGMSFIEVLITLFLTTVGVMALLSMQPISWQTAGRSDFMGRAAGILQSELEQIEVRVMNPNQTVATGTTTRTVYPSGADHGPERAMLHTRSRRPSRRSAPMPGASTRESPGRGTTGALPSL